MTTDARYGVFAGGDLVSEVDSYEEAMELADDVRGTHPDLEVGVDVIIEWEDE